MTNEDYCNLLKIVQAKWEAEIEGKIAVIAELKGRIRILTRDVERERENSDNWREWAMALRDASKQLCEKTVSQDIDQLNAEIAELQQSLALVKEEKDFLRRELNRLYALQGNGCAASN